MDNLIRKKLQDLIAHRGQGLCLESERCKAALKEICARHPAEQFVLVSMVDLGMLPQIIDINEESWSDVAEQLAGRLQKERSLNRDAARWGVDTWALALGKIDEAELRNIESLALGRSSEGMTLDRRLLGALVAGAVYGLLLWAVGWAVSWGLIDIARGALIGAALGVFRAVRDGALSPWIVAAWSVGGAGGAILFQGTEGRIIEPLTGTAAWVLSSALGRAILVGRSGGDTSAPAVAVLAGILGPSVGWPCAGLLTSVANAQLEAPWSWAFIGLCAGALQGVLDQSGRNWRHRVGVAIVRTAMAGLLALGAGFLSAQGEPFGWIISGAVLWLVPGVLYRPHDRHAGPVWAVAVSPSSQFALSASLDGSIGLWQLGQRELVGFVRQHGGPVYAVAFSNDGLLCASGGADSIVRVVDGNTGDQVFGFTGHTDTVLAVTFSPADTMLVSAGADATIRLWNLKAGEEAHILRGHDGPVTSVAYSRDGGRIVSSSLDGTVRIWDAAEAKQTMQLDVRTPVHAAAFTPDGAQVVVAADGGLSLWDAAMRQSLRVFAGHEGAVHDVTVTPDGTRLLSAGADATVRLWARGSGEELACIRGHQGPVRGVALASNGRFALSAGDDGSVRLFGFPESPLTQDVEEDDDQPM